MSAQRLKDEIQWLEGLLDRTILHLAGVDIQEQFATLRQLAVARRAGDSGAAEQMIDLVNGLTPAATQKLIRGLGFYFDLANLAEDRHRVKVLREREIQLADQPRSESIGDAIQRLKVQGISARDLQSLLDRLMIEPVFTAHPTEAKRKSLREKIRDIRQHLYDLDQMGLIRRAQIRLHRELETDLATLWQTDLLRERPPTVLEELNRSLYFFETLWKIVPEVYGELEESLIEHYPQQEFRIPVFLRFGTWIGGDRDGNPNVTWEITSQAIWRLRQLVLQNHWRQCRVLRRGLSQSATNAMIAPELQERLRHVQRRWPVLNELVKPIAPTETYRRFLRVVQWRLECTRASGPFQPLSEGAYGNAAEFLSDLKSIRSSLAAAAAGRLLAARLDTWIWQTKVFGFHAMRMDVRQESSRYHHVLDEVFRRSGITDQYLQLDEDTRQSLLTTSLNQESHFSTDAVAESSRETLQLFRLLAETTRINGPDALGCHIISMAHCPSDVLAVLLLGRWAAQQAGIESGQIPMPIVPLFETIDDLRNAAKTLNTILQHPTYRHHVSQNGQQIVMIGYSDSTKDGGYLAACWAQFRAQLEMSHVAGRHHIRSIFFHGRGGALGRGGGPAARSVMSSPRVTIDGAMRVTEQGEVLSARYDDPQIAFRHLEQIISATMLATISSTELPREYWLELMDQLADRAWRTYRDLIERPGFIRLFEQMTPIAEIERLPLGSRPSRRSGQRELGQLRAIPWVFAWTQNRCLLPAWFGIGTAIESYIDDHADGLDVLQQAFCEWPFFNGLIENAALALAKADIEIARSYAQLACRDPESRELWQRIQQDFLASCNAILAITGRARLLENIPWLQDSINNRNPYVDPLNFIQIKLLREIRSGTDTFIDSEGQTEAVHSPMELVRLTVQAIAAGLRTTG